MEVLGDGGEELRGLGFEEGYPSEDASARLADEVLV